MFSISVACFRISEVFIMFSRHPRWFSAAQSLRMGRPAGHSSGRTFAVALLLSPETPPWSAGIEAGRPLGCLGAKTHGIHCGILVLHVWNGWVAGLLGWLLLVMTGIIPENSLRLAPVRISMNIMEWLWKVWNSLIWTIWVTGHVVMSQTIIFEVLLDSQISMNDPIKLPWSRFLIGSCEIGIGSRFVSLFLSDDVASIITPWWHSQSSA